MTGPPTLEPTPHDLKLWMPGEEELAKILGETLYHWGGLSIQPLEWRGFEGPSRLALERRLDFIAPHSGILVARCPEKLSTQLSDLMYEQRQLARSREEAIQEVLVLFWYRLAVRYWKADPSQFRPALFRPSRPLDWPGRQPDVACIALVLKQPIEILLWAE
jgi:hypothetical protein